MRKHSALVRNGTYIILRELFSFESTLAFPWGELSCGVSASSLRQTQLTGTRACT
uniref:Uncharacterized protein n=1 Tax=Arundo donax TaxID=35708 RepID=A0A0A9AEA8_ARUDO